jgi:hypothetical protein
MMRSSKTTVRRNGTTLPTLRGTSFAGVTFGEQTGRHSIVSVRYNLAVARGWESKSVEEQQAQVAESQGNLDLKLAPDELAKWHLKDGLMLSRKRIIQQLESAQNPPRRTMLESALSHLDAEIARLG